MKRYFIVIDDSLSLVGPDIQTTEIQRVLKERGVEESHTHFINFDEITSAQKLAEAAREKKASNLICYRLASIRAVVHSFEELCELVADLKASNIEFESLRESVSTEDGLGPFLRTATHGWKEARANYKQENAKVSQIKAKSNGTRLGRPTTSDDKTIQSLRAAGSSMREIAAKTGVSFSSVQRVLSKTEPRP